MGWLEEFTPATFCATHRNFLADGSERLAAAPASVGSPTGMGTGTSPRDAMLNASSLADTRVIYPRLAVPTDARMSPQALEIQTHHPPSRHGPELTGIQPVEQRPLILPSAECEQNKSLPAQSVLGKRARPESDTENAHHRGGHTRPDASQSES